MSQKFGSLSSKDTSGNKASLGQRLASRKCLALGIMVLVITALAVGLGVGLTRAKASPITTLTGSSTNGTFWRPAAGTLWQIELLTPLTDTSVVAPVYDIDLFNNPASTISNLHDLGRKVICYFSAGSYEDFRSDSSKFKTSDYGKGLDGWPGEYWLNTSSANVRSIMLSRIDLAVTKGCDGVDPDNIDGYANDSGMDLTEETAVDYMTFLASEAHGRNLSIGLKNGGAIVNKTLDMMQWQVNEQCVEFNECQDLRPFIDAGKPVFHIEYPTVATIPNVVNAGKKAIICSTASATGFSTILKNLNLDNWVDYC